MSDRRRADARESPAAKTILFVEGKGLRQSVSLSLSSNGYHLLLAGNGEEALKKAIEFKASIDLLLANVELPDMTGIELAEQLGRQRPETEIFLVTNLKSGVLVLNHGWHFLPTPFESDMIRARIRDILRVPAPVTRAGADDSSGKQQVLTTREIQVLKLIAGGNSTKQVAAILGIAFKTSVGHRSRLMKKLHIHDAISLVRYAIRAGLVDP